MEMFTIQETIDNADNYNVMQAVVSFLPPVSAGGHIVDKDDIGFVVNTDGGVLLGKMSFQMTADKFDINWLHLVQDAESTAPTGIKISLDGTNYFEAQSTFRFTEEKTAVDATLSDLKVSRQIINEDTPENSETKEYELTPVFNKDVDNYELTLLEYIDTLDITATQTDETSTMKIKVPKRDTQTNELIYENEEKTIVTYEEKEIIKDTPLQIVLNKLGEPNTNITIIVTAGDGTTTKEYNLVIKRPYATVIGKNILSDFDNEGTVENLQDTYGIEISNSADINIYKADLIEWESITDIYGINYENPTKYEDIENVPKECTYKSNKDGTFEIYVIPGTYDIQVTRLAYLDHIYSDVVVNEGDIIDMGTFRMLAGDADRDGVVTAEDMAKIKASMDMESADPDFSPAFNPTQVGAVLVEDLAYVKANLDAELTIINFGQ